MEEENQTEEEDFSETLKENKAPAEEAIISLSEELKIHKRSKKSFLGKATLLEKNHAKVSFETTHDMITDDLGLIHSGFIYSSADYTATIAINEPNTVTIGSKVSFLAPAKSGDIINFEAKVRFEDLKKREIEVRGKINEIEVFKGTFYVVVLDKHIFKTKIKNVKREYSE